MMQADYTCKRIILMTDLETQQRCMHSYWKPHFTRAGDPIGFYCPQCDRTRTLGEPDLPEVEVTRRSLMEQLMARPDTQLAKVPMRRSTVKLLPAATPNTSPSRDQ